MVLQLTNSLKFNFSLVLIIGKALTELTKLIDLTAIYGNRKKLHFLDVRIYLINSRSWMKQF